MSDDEYLYVDRERVRALITTLNTSADTLGAVHVDQQVGAVSNAVAGTGVGAACSAGASSAATSVESCVQRVRTLGASTASGLATVEATDQHNAGQFPPGN
ncbi:hypothetical protein [Nocardia sp. NPDC056100]|uniref:hypothetical protein n=1 Tax=Nocardia sp. NPDC056100 TaxID=3345712 RepID=UPI0035DB1736